MIILSKIFVDNNYNNGIAADINRIPTAEALRRQIKCGKSRNKRVYVQLPRDRVNRVIFKFTRQTK